MLMVCLFCALVKAQLSWVKMHGQQTAAMHMTLLVSNVTLGTVLDFTYVCTFPAQPTHIIHKHTNTHTHTQAACHTACSLHECSLHRHPIPFHKQQLRSQARIHPQACQHSGPIAQSMYTNPGPLHLLFIGLSMFNNSFVFSPLPGNMSTTGVAQGNPHKSPSTEDKL